MAERTIRLTDQEIHRIEAIVLDRDKENAPLFFKDVINEKLRVTEAHACGPKAV